MKFRESGMPDEKLWDTFFNSQEILEKMEIDNKLNNFMDIGCGYGTFLIPASRRIRGKAIGVDIDKEMINYCQNKIEVNDITNVDLLHYDVLSASGAFALIKNYKEKIDYLGLFNILHCEEPERLLALAYIILKINGKAGIIHWKYDQTPRGPSMDIRPTPEQIIKWAATAGFTVSKQVDLLPYHYGIIFSK